MTTKALILTPSKGFGELIRQVLTDAGSFDPVLLSDLGQAMEAAHKSPLGLVVLDADFGSHQLTGTINDLRELAPGFHLIVIPAEENPTDPQLANLGAAAILPSPFYLPNLVAAIEQLYGPLVAKESAKRSTYGSAPAKFKVTQHLEVAAPDWLQDVDLAAQYLTRLSLESASQAALITRGQKVWAYAGELPQPAAEELAAAVSQHAANGNAADLARFVHLDATKADYMLYATSLGGEYTLALVFDAQVPFSQMRAQVNKLANALASAPQQEMANGRAVHTRRNATVQLQGENMGQGGVPDERLPKYGAFGPQVPRADFPSARTAGASNLGAGLAAGQTGRLEPLSAGSYDLHYAYLLIPRLPGHRLEGDLAEKLAQWLPQLCVAFAWRLENISVQPDFLHWMLSMAPETSPESVVHTLEKHLSERIFDEFPRLKRENPSGQFFAPGFLIVNGALPSSDLISEYIQQTRARQGVSN
jgi:REP element-mobilizing transposase RayT/DNA-binding response OmpR family regulator